MSTVDKIEMSFIVIESISIIVEIILQIYQIKSSKQGEQKILKKLEEK